MITKIAAAAALALMMGIGAASADSVGAPALQAFQNTTAPTSSNHFGGSDLSVMGGSMTRAGGSTVNKFDCLQAQNKGNSSNIRAYCPPNTWLPG